ncbi:MAG: PepSY domain-containing protein [Anaerolineales bacterium]
MSREQAIEIARQRLDFEAKSVEAVRATDEGRPVWRVTFRGEDIGPARPMGEVLIVLVDRKTGEVVSVGMS